MRFIDLTGQKFNKLEVLKFSHKDKSKKHIYWICQCNCGNKTIIEGSKLKSGHTKSCGCWALEVSTEKAKTHEMIKTSEYKSWQGTKDRCYNKNNHKYKIYGYRGIKVCERWLNSFENFYKDMGNKPTSKHSIDRIDNNGNYCKENCRWATVKQQARNKRTNKMITYKGETKCLAEWAERLGIKYGTLFVRLSRGWATEKALSIKQSKLCC